MRVAVLGNSCAMLVARDAEGRHGRPYWELLEDLLDDGTSRVQVVNASRFGGTIAGAVQDWERAVLAPRPGLVVVHHGVLEARPAVQPMALLRWTHRPAHSDTAASRAGVAAARLLERPLDGVCRIVERKAVLPGHMSPQRFARQLTRLLRWTEEHVGAAVAVVDLPSATPYLARESPGYGVRRDALQAVTDRVVAAHRDAFAVSLRGAEEELGIAGVYGDGVHFTAAAHRRVAEGVVDGLRRLWPGST